MPETFIPSPGSTTLIVVLHGFGASAKRLTDVISTARTLLPGSDVFAPILWHGWMSNKSPVSVTLEAIRAIDEILARHPYERIVLIGYSGGGIIARKLVVYVNGEQKNAPFETEADSVRDGRPWATRIDRVALLAGMNRGWTFSPTFNVFATAAMRLLYAIARAVGLMGLFASVRRGEPFIADLRIQWLTFTKTKKVPTVVQLLGTIDDIVSPDDNIDLQTGGDFYYLDVPDSGHKSVIDFAPTPAGQTRRAVFAAALTHTRDEFEAECLPPSLGAEERVDAEIKHVLFVIHGIRDYGFWTAHVARHVAGRALKRGVRIVPLTPSYGYFAMLPFVLPGTRRAKVRWFVEEYVKALARFPNAEHFSYIGHSNGTYLLAGALTYYRGCHFKNVVFAGSVVRADFAWAAFIPARVARVLNYVASADWVVALFPRFLATLRQDVGGAGWDGFVRTPLDETRPVNDAEYVLGAHSTALREENWDDIADFILADKLPKNRRFETDHHWFVRTLAAIAPAIWIGLLGVIFVPPLWAALYASWSVGGRMLFALVWLMTMRAVLTRL